MPSQLFSVVSAEVQINETQVQKKIAQFVHAELQSRYLEPKTNASVTIKSGRVLGAPVKFLTADLPAHVQWELSSSLAHFYSNRVIVKARLMEGGQSVDLAVPVEITIQKPVWVLRNAIMPGQLIERADVAQENRDVSIQLPNLVSMPPNEWPQYAARIPLRPGDLLDRRQILIPPDVRRNEEVWVTLKCDKGFEITLMGIALDEGRIGQTVRVQNRLNRDRYYTARVVKKNHVEVNI
ncbi:MAG: flagellar basal body P-ring formation chaperone FlgA [Cyanobacteria bacterium]|nr:flagellar basal body P-ring formation chaperone FlgA [Cyanobacteriota bacterium]